MLLLRSTPLGSGASELPVIATVADRLDDVMPADTVPAHITGMTVAGRDRIIVSAAELPRTDRYLPQSDTNLWELRLDGRIPPRRLTNWTGFNIESLSATPDGSRLSFLQSK